MKISSLGDGDHSPLKITLAKASFGLDERILSSFQRLSDKTREADNVRHRISKLFVEFHSTDLNFAS